MWEGTPGSSSRVCTGDPAQGVLGCWALCPHRVVGCVGLGEAGMAKEQLRGGVHGDGDVWATVPSYVFAELVKKIGGTEQLGTHLPALIG